MRLELQDFGTKIDGLRALVNGTFTLRENMTARIKTPKKFDTNFEIGEVPARYEDAIQLPFHERNLWGAALESRTMHLYGGLNSDGRIIFKIDNKPNLANILEHRSYKDRNYGTDFANEQLIAIDRATYIRSRGTEYVVIRGEEIGSDVDYAIKADRYSKVRIKLNKGDLTAVELSKAGGFKVNVKLTPREVKASDGWREYAFGDNITTLRKNELALKFLSAYLRASNRYESSSNGGPLPLEFRVKTTGSRHIAWPVSLPEGNSHFYHDGRYFESAPSCGFFLKVKRQ